MFDPNRQPSRGSRFEVTRLALQEVGSPGHVQIMAYHRNAIGRDVGQRELEWCGLFCLSMLHDAGIGLDVHWHLGGGFCEEQHLPRVAIPEPGDVAYYNLPYRHHALVVAVDADAGTFDSVDGNQAGDTIAHRQGIHLSKPTCFYSIAPLLAKAVAT